MKQEHDLSAEEARAQIERLADKLASRLGGSWDWDGDTAVCESRGARARVGYDETNVWLDVTLPRMLKPLRKTLEAKVEEVFEREFRRT